MKEIFTNKKVLFITTKNLDYLRNVQEIEMIKGCAESVEILGFSDKSYAKRLAKLYFKLLFMSTKKYDVVFIGFAPQLIVPMFNFKFRKKQVVMDFFISVYDTMVFDRKKFTQNSLIGKFCKWLDKKCIAKADKVICDTNAHGDYFSEEFGKERSKVSTLYLEADESIYYKRQLEKPEQLKEKFVVLYFGSILPLQGVDIINGAIDILKDNDKLYFYMIGPIKNQADKAKSQNVEYIPWLAQEKLAEYIAYSDLCLAGHFNKDINKAKRTIPGKAYIYEAMDKPMILGENSANRELHSENSKKYFVEMGNSKALAEKILQVMKEKF